MSIVLPIAAFFFLYRSFVCLAIRNSAGAQYIDRREHFLNAAVLWGVLLTFLTEVLGMMDLVDRWSVIISWLTILALTGVLLVIWQCVRFRDSSSLMLNWWKNDVFIRVSQLGTIFFAGVIFVIGIVLPPGTIDTLTYHLPRVMYWIQQGSVDHYPCHTLRQLYQPPWAEFVLLHFQLLVDSDRFAHLVQWLAMVGSLVIISFLTALWGADRQGQYLAIVLSVTLPIGILEGSSTQNDYVSSFWLLCFIISVWILPGPEARFGQHILGTTRVACSLGLALLTKATSYVLVVPFVIWFCFRLLHVSRGMRTFILHGLLTMFCVLMLVSPSVWRNIKLSGHFFGPLDQEEITIINDQFNPGGLISNIVRNFSMQLNTPFAQLNKLIEQSVVGCHELFGLDVNDAGTTWRDTKFRLYNCYVIHEDFVSNPIHMVIFLTAFAGLIIGRSFDVRIKFFMFLILTSAVLFCLIFRWQPWHTRLHLPLLLLMVPGASLWLRRVCTLRCLTGIILTLFLLALPILLINESRPPLLSENGLFNCERTQLYFINRKHLLGPYQKIVRLITERGSTSVGLLAGSGDKGGDFLVSGMEEYPLWVMLKQKTKMRFDHVGVRNYSIKKQKKTPDPAAVICWYPSVQELDYYVSRGWSVYGDTRLVLFLSDR